MAILEIRKYPHPILRKKSEEIKEITKDIKKLVEDMIETLKENLGVGLAAPQAGILKRVIVVETEKGARGFINPAIIRKSREKDIDFEGCLSLPKVPPQRIKRAKKIEVEALDKDGKILKIKAEGLLSRIFQHEIDHLDGILFIDRLSFWQRLKIKYRNVLIQP